MDFYENVYESNISASPTRMIQLGDKGNLQSEKQKKIILIATNPIRDNELNLRTTNYYFFLKACFYRRLQIHVYKQNAIFFILQNIFV